MSGSASALASKVHFPSFQSSQIPSMSDSDNTPTSSEGVHGGEEGRRSMCAAFLSSGAWECTVAPALSLNFNALAHLGSTWSQ